MDNYINKALVGFNARNMLEAKYLGDEYLAVIVSGKIVLFSRTPISNSSQQYRNGFSTMVDIEDLDDIYITKLDAMYMNNLYRVQMVGPDFSSIELLARDGMTREDLALGFEDNMYERVTHKIVSLGDISGLEIETKDSVYDGLVEKFGKK